MATCFDPLRVIFRPKNLMIYPDSCTYEMGSSQRVETRSHVKNFTPIHMQLRLTETFFLLF
jgi:hypothetical protein